MAVVAGGLALASDEISVVGHVRRDGHFLEQMPAVFDVDYVFFGQTRSDEFVLVRAESECEHTV